MQTFLQWALGGLDTQAYALNHNLHTIRQRVMRPYDHMELRLSQWCCTPVLRQRRRGIQAVLHAAARAIGLGQASKAESKKAEAAQRDFGAGIGSVGLRN